MTDIRHEARYVSQPAPSFKSHYRPRTRAGWIAVFAFLGLFLFIQPPLVFWIANRSDPWVLGLPFFYVYMLVLYCALIGVLLWAKRKEL